MEKKKTGYCQWQGILREEKIICSSFKPNAVVYSGYWIYVIPM
jgi:hypothetical protein